MKDWIDLSIQLNEKTWPFPGDDPLKIEWMKTFENDQYRLSKVSSTMHLGTHLDFRNHVLEEKVNLDVNQFIGRANVIFVEPKAGVIRTKDIEHAYQYIDHFEQMLLLSTNQSRFLNTAQYYEYPKFEPSILDFLKRHHINLLGADLPSFEYTEGPMLKMHQDCYRNEVYFLENLTNLERLTSHIELIVLPLPIQGIEASWVRPIARNL